MSKGELEAYRYVVEALNIAHVHDGGVKEVVVHPLLPS